MNKHRRRRPLARALLAAAAAALLAAGCTDLFNSGIDIDAELLPGEWTSGTLHETYLQDGNGYTWDTADDVTEDEAQPFSWTLDGQTLTQYHHLEMGATVPKTYTVTTLTPCTLKYHDDYGICYTFSR